MGSQQLGHQGGFWQNPGAGSACARMVAQRETVVVCLRTPPPLPVWTLATALGHRRLTKRLVTRQCVADQWLGCHGGQCKQATQDQRDALY